MPRASKTGWNPLFQKKLRGLLRPSFFLRVKLEDESTTDRSQLLPGGVSSQPPALECNYLEVVGQVAGPETHRPRCSSIAFSRFQPLQRFTNHARRLIRLIRSDYAADPGFNSIADRQRFPVPDQFLLQPDCLGT